MPSKESDTKLTDTEGSGRGLKEIQAFLVSSIKEPLTDEFLLDKSKLAMAEVDSIVKPSSKQTASQRLEIYAQQYWYRLLDSLEEDFTGILAVLGRERFNRLLIAYLKEYPSDSHLLRDLGRYLDEFVRDNESLVEPHFSLVYDLARFEWAQVFAFDGEQLPPITLPEIENLELETHVFEIQPYITLLQLNFPLDDFKIALKKDKKPSNSSEASSTKRFSVDENSEAIVSLPPKEEIHLVVHRYDSRVFFKRLDRHAFKLLELIAAGNSLSIACGELINAYPQLESDMEELASNVKDWFRVWVKLGWIVSAERISSD